MTAASRRTIVKPDQDEPAITRTPLMLPELLQFLIGDVLRIRVRCNLLGLPAFVIE